MGRSGYKWRIQHTLAERVWVYVLCVGLVRRMTLMRDLFLAQWAFPCLTALTCDSKNACTTPLSCQAHTFRHCAVPIQDSQAHSSAPVACNAVTVPLLMCHPLHVWICCHSINICLQITCDCLGCRPRPKPAVTRHCCHVMCVVCCVTTSRRPGGYVILMRCYN